MAELGWLLGHCYEADDQDLLPGWCFTGSGEPPQIKLIKFRLATFSSKKYTECTFQRPG